MNVGNVVLFARKDKMDKEKKHNEQKLKSLRKQYEKVCEELDDLNRLAFELEQEMIYFRKGIYGGIKMDTQKIEINQCLHIRGNKKGKVTKNERLNKIEV